MRPAWILLLLFAVACSNDDQSPENVIQLWTEAISDSDFDAAARLMAPGYKDHWLACTLAVLPWFGLGMPEVTAALLRVEKKHGYTLDELTFQNALEEQHVAAIAERISVVEDREALLADVLRVQMTMVGRMANETGYPQDRGREPDWKELLEETRTVQIDGRWFVVLDLPTVATSFEAQTYGNLYRAK